MRSLLAEKGYDRETTRSELGMAEPQKGSDRYALYAYMLCFHVLSMKSQRFNSPAKQSNEAMPSMCCHMVKVENTALLYLLEVRKIQLL